MKSNKQFISKYIDFNDNGRSLQTYMSGRKVTQMMAQTVCRPYIGHLACDLTELSVLVTVVRERRYRNTGATFSKDGTPMPVVA